MKLIAKLAVCASLSLGTVLGATAAFAKPARQAVLSAYSGKDGSFGGKTGQVIFTDGKMDAKNPNGHAGNLSFAKGAMSTGWYGRGFFPGNLKEIATTFKKQRKHLVLEAVLHGAGKSHVLFQKKLDKKWEKWQWYTFTGANKNVQKAMASLAPGDYNGSINFKIISYDDSKKKGADKESMVIASGPIKITVTP